MNDKQRAYEFGILAADAIKLLGPTEAALELVVRLEKIDTAPNDPAHDNHEATLYTILCNARQRRIHGELMDPRWVIVIVEESLGGAVLEWDTLTRGLENYRAALVDIVAKLGGRPEGDELDDYAVYAINRAHKALSE